MKRWLIPCALILYTVAIILPPIIHGYVYPNTGDDSAVHLSHIQAYADGQVTLKSLASAYWGEAMVGAPIAFFHNTFGWSLDVQFLWFNYFVLWLVGISVYLLAGYVTNWYAGLLAIPVVMFVGPSVLNLFDNGSVFDLLTIGVLVPLGILAFLLAMKNKRWLIPLGILIALAVGVHSIGIFKSYGSPAQAATPWTEFIAVMLGWYLVILLAFGILGIALKTPKSKIAPKAYGTLIVFSALIIAGLVLAFTKITPWATRFATDSAVLLGMLSGVLISMVVNRLIVSQSLIITLIVMLSCIPVFTSYYGYNSAVTPTDLKAIRYITGMPGNQYSVSPTINPLIYGRFTERIYKNGALPYIDRNKPMTSGSTNGTADYIWKNGAGIVPVGHSLQTFSGEGVVINVTH